MFVPLFGAFTCPHCAEVSFISNVSPKNLSIKNPYLPTYPNFFGLLPETQDLLGLIENLGVI